MKIHKNHSRIILFYMFIKTQQRTMAQLLWWDSLGSLPFTGSDLYLFPFTLTVQCPLVPTGHTPLVRLTFGDPSPAGLLELSLRWALTFVFWLPALCIWARVAVSFSQGFQMQAAFFTSLLVPYPKEGSSCTKGLETMQITVFLKKNKNK